VTVRRIVTTSVVSARRIGWLWMFALAFIVTACGQNGSTSY